MKKRIVRGMRLTGKMHLGHLHGVLNNWIRLQTTSDSVSLQIGIRLQPRQMD
jgi:tryptophanyl-tRNA synthetase